MWCDDVIRNTLFQFLKRCIVVYTHIWYDMKIRSVPIPTENSDFKIKMGNKNILLSTQHTHINSMGYPTQFIQPRIMMILNWGSFVFVSMSENLLWKRRRRIRKDTSLYECAWKITICFCCCCCSRSVKIIRCTMKVCISVWVCLWISVGYWIQANYKKRKEKKKKNITKV